MAHNLEQFVDSISDRDPGRPLEQAGPSGKQLALSLGDPNAARRLIANAFWQAFMNSTALFRTAQILNVRVQGLLASEKIVVYRHNYERFDLLCFVEGPMGTPQYALVNPTPSELVSGAANFFRKVRHYPGNQALYNPILAIEALEASPFAIIVMPAPETVLTKLPSHCCSVTDVAGTMLSTAGVVALDTGGRIGVTAAYHAVLDAPQVEVGGILGYVRVSDLVTDSCFIEVLPPQVGTKGLNGPMQNMLPRGNQRASFEGSTSGMTTTRITAWSLELPNVLQNTQGKLYTSLCTNPGDSGAALVTDDDYVVGFAYEMSGPNSPIEFSSWIWADSVYKALHLT
jgi:hypothetical protein